MEYTGNLEVHVKNIDDRLARVEQILPTLAAKDDLERFATKADLERFATKEDLEPFATKDYTSTAIERALEAHGEREGRAMREFVLETVRHSSEDVLRKVGVELQKITDEMRRGFAEVQRGLAEMHAMLRAVANGEYEQRRMLGERVDRLSAHVAAVDAESKARDYALDRPVLPFDT